jgi:hypothetical protein
MASNEINHTVVQCHNTVTTHARTHRFLGDALCLFLCLFLDPFGFFLRILFDLLQTPAQVNHTGGSDGQSTSESHRGQRWAVEMSAQVNHTGGSDGQSTSESHRGQ